MECGGNGMALRAPARIRMGREARAQLLFILWVVALGPVAYVAALTKLLGHNAAWDVLLRYYGVAMLHFLAWSAAFGFGMYRYRLSTARTRRLLRYGACLALALVVLGSMRLPGPSMRHWLDDGLVALVVLVVERLHHKLVVTRIQAEHRELENERARRAAIEARWGSLESRVRPHFLFNTLSSIRELMHRDIMRADAMIQRFAELLRFSLDSNSAAAVPLEQEIRIVSGYLEIERMRLGARLRWELDVAPECRTCTVPALAVLTLIENSIKYAVAARQKGGHVAIRARIREQALEIVVADDGPGFSPDAIPAGHGLDLLLERLKTWAGGTGQMLICADGSGTAITLTLPVLAEVIA